MDPIPGWPFTLQQLQGSVNLLNARFGLVNSLGLFNLEPIGTTIVGIEYKEGAIRILANKPRGTSGDSGQRDTRKVYWIELPHFPHPDFIGPDDLQDFRSIAATGNPEMLADKLNRRMLLMRSQHELTWEFMKMGALKGLVIDGNGDVLVDLYTWLGKTKTVAYFDLDNANTDVVGKCEEVVEHMESEAKGETVTGSAAVVSSAFMQKLVTHPKVEKFYLQHQAATMLATKAVRDVFTFGGIEFRTYRGSASDAKGVTQKFVAAGKGHAYPTGTLDTFGGAYGPPYDIRAVNERPAEMIHVTQELLKHGRGIELESQSNVLPVVKRPELLVELDAGAQP